jgi:hypothetical protein
LRVATLLFCSVLCACLQTRLPEGVLAVVNGEPIYLRTVQALLDGHASAGGTWETRSLKIMKSRYGEALGTLIVNALVRQELARRDMAVTDGDVAEALDKVRSDYGGQEDFNLVLAEKSLNETEWLNLLRDHLSVRRFEKNILLPGIRVGADDVRAYYREHEDSFRLPEIYDVCLASSDKKEYLEVYGRAFAETAAFPSGVAGQCLSVALKDIPPEWRKTLPELAAGACSGATARGSSWEMLCLKRRLPAGIAGIAGVYAFIERQLLESRRQAVFERWLETCLAGADIRVSPHIKDDLLAARGEVALPENADRSDASAPVAK